MPPVSVLLADDDAMFRHLMTRALAGHFHVLATVGDGRQLVDRAAMLKPDVIVSDVHMPVLSGIEALRILKKGGCRAKFVLTSSDTVLAPECLQAGADAFVPKDRLWALLPAAVAAMVPTSHACQAEPLPADAERAEVRSRPD